MVLYTCNGSIIIFDISGGTRVLLFLVTGTRDTFLLLNVQAYAGMALSVLILVCRSASIVIMFLLWYVIYRFIVNNVQHLSKMVILWMGITAPWDKLPDNIPASSDHVEVQTNSTAHPSLLAHF